MLQNPQLLERLGPFGRRPGPLRIAPEGGPPEEVHSDMPEVAVARPGVAHQRNRPPRKPQRPPLPVRRHYFNKIPVRKILRPADRKCQCRELDRPNLLHPRDHADERRAGEAEVVRLHIHNDPPADLLGRFRRPL